ncbi:MAG: type transport system permease protein [Solirubrobacteraceae bacterium]|jgi:ABC transporter DrrB family efflux protein|nr:type transport system permease protein [Solirubrobacteraceae bacterium]
MSSISVNRTPSTEPPAFAEPRAGMASFARDTLLITRRHLLRTWRTPQIIIFSAVMPVVFVLLFRYVFGGAIHVPGYAHYVDYLIPGIVVQTVLFGGSSTAVGMAEDLSSGMTDRLRSLPTNRAAILASRTLADLLRLTYTVALVIAVGFLVGFRFHSGPVRVAEGIALALLFGYACSWLFALLALTARQTETAQMGAFLFTFPIVFASSIFASPATMPTWLRDFANVQPVTKVVDALRVLAEGNGSATRPALYAIAWSVGLLIFAATAATLRFRRG